MRHSKVYVATINAINEEIADQSALIASLKDLDVGTSEEAKLDILDRELQILFNLTHLKNEISLIIKDREEKGEF